MDETHNLDSGSEDLETVFNDNDYVGGGIDRFILFVSKTAWSHCIYSFIHLFFYSCQKEIF